MSDQCKDRSINGSLPIPLREAVATILKQMEDAGYRADVLRYYRRSYRWILVFAEGKGITEYTPEFGEMILNEFAREVSMKTTGAKTRMKDGRRAIHKLHGFSVHNRWRVRAGNIRKIEIPGAFAEGFNAFVEYRETECCVAPNTLNNEKRCLSQFLQFLSQRGVKKWGGIYPAVFSEFCVTFTTWAPRTLDLLSSHLRIFMRFLLMRGFATTNWEEFIPRFRPFAGQRLPAVLPRGAADAILAAVDRTTVQGKRDYAILLLACRLGMRFGDIRKLCLDHLRWDDGRIEYVQNKTGKQIALPMTEDVGTALIDYLSHGRPHTKFREVFIRTRAPHQPLGDGRFHNQLSKYRRLAGVARQDGIPCGMHSFRHTLASELLTAEIPFDTISQILGHTSADSTRVYARVDIEQLRTVALDPEEVCHA